MSWPTFLSPEWSLLGLLAVPLIALYLLRQKRPNQRTSSTLLWSKTLADMRASSPFQKLRRNLLLFLQLLILAALVLTLMRPVVQAQAARSVAGVIVIDATASMQTRDGAGETTTPLADTPTRLDRAKTEARKLVDSMRPGDRFMLIADGGGLNQVRSGFSTSKSELNGIIDSIKPADTTSDLSESLLLAASSLKAIGATKSPTDAVAPGKVYLFSDGAGIKVPDVMGADTSLLQFIRIGNSDHSVGITALSIAPLKDAQTYQVFVGLKNAWDQPRKIGVTLSLNDPDNFLPGQAKYVTLPANGQGAAVFEKVVSAPGRLFVRIDDAADDFPLDNTAYGMLQPPRLPAILLVTTGNEVLENYLKTVIRVGAATGQIVAPAAYSPAFPADLVIFDGFVPPTAQMPHIDTLIIRPVVTGAGDVGGFHVLSELEDPTVLRWKRDDPLMQFVELNELRLFRALLLDRDPQAVELVSAPESPLIEYKDFGSIRRYFVSFSPLLESNWYKLPSFLIFLQNILDETRARHFIGIPEILPAGTPARIWALAPDAAAPGSTPASVKVTTPDGSVLSLSSSDNEVEFAATDKVGFYTVSGANDKTAEFAVNVLSAAESDIRPASLHTSAGGNVEEAAGVASVNKEVWPWVASAALAVLLLEWWAYHRRVA